SMAAVAGRDGQSGTLRIGSDPKISIMSIAIETDAREYNWGIRQRGKRAGQKMAHLVFLLFRHDALGRIWGHLASGPMIRDFHHAVAIEGETVIASGRNIRAENWKTFWSEKFRLFRFEMKYRLPASAEKIAREWQCVRRPGANGHHNRSRPNFFPIFQHEPFYPIARFVQIPEPCIFAQFHTERLRPLD